MSTIVECSEIAPGFSISRVITGLWQIADMERNGYTLDLETTANAMKPYVDAGFTTFDMADHYGSAEIIAGLFLKQHSVEVQMFTKWVPKPGPISKKDVRAAVQKALDRMQTNQIDLFQYHTWNYIDPNWLDNLYWLQEFKREGLIRFLGLVNFDTAHLRMAITSGIDIMSNQVCFSLLDQRAKTGMTELCLRHGIKLLAFGTIAGGFLTEKWLGKPEPDWDELNTWSEMKYKRFIDTAGGWKAFQDLLYTVHGIAQKCCVSIANVVCRHILDEPAVGGVIIGARLGKSEHIQDNLRLFQFSLDEESCSKIAKVLKILTPIPGDCGDEYRKPPFLTAAGDLSHHLESIPPPYKTKSLDDNRGITLYGTPWEEVAGHGQAVRRGNRIFISGIAASLGDRVIGENDVVAQMHFVMDKIEGAIQSLGGKLQDIIRTQINIRDVLDRGVVAHVLSERFQTNLPANALIQTKLSEGKYLVEMEVEAVVGV